MLIIEKNNSRGANLINKMEKGVSYSQKCILIFTEARLLHTFRIENRKKAHKALTFIVIDSLCEREFGIRITPSAA